MQEKKPKLSFVPQVEQQIEAVEPPQEKPELKYEGSQPPTLDDTIENYLQIYIKFHNLCKEANIPEVLVFPLFQEWLKH
jgi:hypothetical protein